MGLLRLLFLKQLIPNPAFQSPKTLSNLIPHLTSNSPLNTRTFSFSSTDPNSNNTTLLAKITLFVAGSPNDSVTPFLNQWVQQGNKVRDTELQRAIRILRSKKRYARALEVSEWMTSRHTSFSGDHAVQLDLIGKVRGIEAAERYFDEVDDHSERMYGALLNCYAKEGLVDKSLALLQKMKELGLAKHPLTYNSIISLYINMNQLEKVPQVISQMEVNGVPLDNVSYRMYIKYFGFRRDFTSIEKVLQKIETQPHITVDWSTYTTVANHFTRGGLHERAVYFLQKAEEKVQKDRLGFNCLITSYGNLGDVSQMLRLWEKKSTSVRHINIDYMTMLGSLAKLGKLQEAETIFKEWESCGNLYDFRVPNTLLIGYTRQGMVEKAEQMLESIIDKGRTPFPNSWSIIASGHVGIRNMEKAVWCMKRALELGPQRQGWEPKPALVSSILAWLGENGGVEEVEEFVELLGRVVRKDREMYYTLLKAKIRHGREIDEVLESMMADNIDVDEETKKILSCR